MDLRFEGVTLHRGGRLVLDVPRLQITGGCTTALLGPNGAGKSSLLRLVAALDRPSNGVVYLDERPARPGRATRNAVAYAFQDAVFLSGTVRKNLDLALRLRGLSSPERVRRIEEAAAACGIAPLLDRRAQQLSGGEAQRASLARALALRAPVTLLDEPLAGLDTGSRRQLLHELPALLAHFAETTVLVTHDRDEAFRLAQDLVVLLDGRVRASGPKARVFAAPPDPDVAALLGYDLFPGERGTVAVAPGALAVGGRGVPVRLTVRRVVELPGHREVEGEWRGALLSAVLPAGVASPRPGDTIAAAAPPEAVVTFPPDGSTTSPQPGH